MSIKKFTNVHVCAIHARLMQALVLSFKIDLAKLLDISIQTLKNRENRGVNNLDDIELLCNKEGLRREWIFSGEGEARHPQPGTVTERTEPTQFDANRWRGVLFKRLQRILDEDDKTKIGAVKGMLKAFDPGGKKQNGTHENDGSGGDLGGKVGL